MTKTIFVAAMVAFISAPVGAKNPQSLLVQNVP